ncbi:AzlC family ABC transporter permease [Carnobacterium gallinarum]|uniref:AzlC family ABC transporter permease n=1 Tax=Carnobacterium gallinarum TaxID=2749 RepID=UPI00054F9DD0|nr:AzlC family ABC transporter permease [Carnobacterium gallinarum]
MQKKVWLESLKVIYPVTLGFIPIGFACGMVLYDAGFSPLAISVMSFLVYAGASQFMVASMIVMGATVPAMIVMTFFLNLRHALMSSSLSTYLKKSSKPFLFLFGHSLADESYAVNYNQFLNHKWDAEHAMATTLIPYFVWGISATIGGLVGTQISINTTIMNYVLIAMFICLLVMQFVSPLFIFVGLLSGVLSVGLMILLHHNIALVIAAIVASIVGFLLDEYVLPRRVKKEQVGEVK